MRLREYQNLTESLQEHAIQNPDQEAVIFWDEHGAVTRIRAAELHHKANTYASLLQQAGIEAGDLVILVLRHSLDLIYAFWGALYLGSVASIFPFLTEKLDPMIYRERVHDLVTQAGAKALITFPENVEDFRNLFGKTQCRIISTAEISESLPEDGTLGFRSDFPAEKIAFLQHSSGTTGLQKGVALTHRAVLNQIQSYSQAIDLRPEDVIVSWLPLYHDMGLIAGFVMPIVTGIPLVLMSPFKWVKNPAILMSAITQEGGTLCWLPNFALNHSARAIRERDIEACDLSRMRLFINCSEPVYHSSQRIFLERFSKVGLRPEHLSVCYAMAENTFAVTQQVPGALPRIDWVSTQSIQRKLIAEPAVAEAAGSTAVVSCGVPISGTEIKIVGKDGLELHDRHVGEVALRSNCMLDGYYHRQDLTSRAVRDGWYLTGDMGYAADGELYITGRKKDLILVGGKNIYPQDLEAIANTLPGFVPGRCAAFGVFDERLGSENIVMVCELTDPDMTEDQKKELEFLLRKSVVQQSEAALSDVRLVGKRWLIKTSSGKISRASNRDKYLREFVQNGASDPN